MRRRASIAIAFAVAALPLGAVAGHAPLEDPNDVRGPLDARAVEVDGGSRWVVTTWPEWGVRRIYDRGYVLIWFDTFGGSAPDYYVMARATGGSMVGALFRDRDRRDDVRVTRVRVTRPDRSSIAARVPLEVMRFDVAATFEWYVQTLMTTKSCPRVCIDRVPDRGRVLEPGPVPSPSPSETSPPPSSR